MSTPLPTSLLNQQHFYIPWDRERPAHKLGVPLARRLQQAHDRPITIACPDMANAPIRTVATSVVTERDGTVTDGSIVLAYCPSHRLARKFVHLTDSLIIVAEWHTASYLGWAKITAALNITTGQTHHDGLTNAGRRAVDQIVACGDLSWTDTPAHNTVDTCLNHLTALGELAPDVISAHARHHWGADPVRTLDKLINNYLGRPRPTPPASLRFT